MSTTYPYALIKALQHIPRGRTAVKTLNDELKATRSTTVRCSPGSISIYLLLIWLKDRSFTSSIQETDDTIPRGHTKKKTQQKPKPVITMHR
jgi:translation initiation factor 2B subunit (eIF-2B alpha/beta/delta family)